MSPDEWDEIHGFDSPREYERFRAWIADALTDEVLVEIRVVRTYSGWSLFDEHSYRTGAGAVWRVVAPEPPFRGVFEQVPSEPSG